MSHRTCTRAATALTLMFLAGCAQVKPHEDYTRTADLIRQRVPTTQVYEPGRSPQAPPVADERLTLEQALQTALLENRRLQAAFHEIGLARADLVQSGLVRNPVLSLAGMLPEGGGRSRLGVGFSQDLADFWQIPIREEAAQATLDETVFVVVREAVDVAAEVKQAYHRLQVLQESERIAREGIDIARRNEELTQARLSAGRTGKADADLARAAVLQAQLSLIDIERRRRIALADLSLAMGSTSSPREDVAFDPLPAPRTQPIQAEACVQQALAGRADLQAVQKAIQAARSRIREQWQMIQPSFMTGFSLERMERRPKVGDSTAGTKTAAGNAGESGKSTSSNTPKEGMIDAVLGPMIALPLPIFDQNQAQIAKATIAHHQAVARYEQLSRQVERDVRAAVADYTAGTATLAFYQDQLIPQLQQNLESTSSAYQAGTASSLAIIDAQRALTTARTELYKARLTQLLAGDELERAMGGPLVHRMD